MGHRHTSSVVYQVFEGEGYTVINGQRFEWTTGDMFAVPSWAWHEHGNESGQQASFFDSRHPSDEGAGSISRRAL